MPIDQSLEEAVYKWYTQQNSWCQWYGNTGNCRKP